MCICRRTSVLSSVRAGSPSSSQGYLTFCERGGEERYKGQQEKQPGSMSLHRSLTIIVDRQLHDADACRRRDGGSSTPHQDNERTTAGCSSAKKHSPGAKLFSRIPLPSTVRPRSSRALLLSQNQHLRIGIYIYISVTRLMRFATAYTETS
jgi:hypothetical protein